ncbi:hypothetical protein EDB87DRAFT_602605 [Lactarius vividus]|nr:hypothetical protein EDB87DRAFT_602605 [Lactarius vividus]
MLCKGTGEVPLVRSPSQSVRVSSKSSSLPPTPSPRLPLLPLQLPNGPVWSPHHGVSLWARQGCFDGRVILGGTVLTQGAQSLAFHVTSEARSAPAPLAGLVHFGSCSGRVGRVGSVVVQDCRRWNRRTGCGVGWGVGWRGMPVVRQQSPG